MGPFPSPWPLGIGLDWIGSINLRRMLRSGRTLGIASWCMSSLMMRRGVASGAACKVQVFRSSTEDPWFNLATEEWIFREMDITKQTLFLWRNQPTVVIGRNQNPWKECNLQAMDAQGVCLARRHSGGGAVYQDRGNTNFTFLSSMQDYSKDRNMKIILQALKTFGIHAAEWGRNDVLVDGKKVSGSAYKLSGDRAFHHGTLLLDVDLGALGAFLNPNKKKLESKGVSSAKQRVMNMASLNPALDHEAVCKAIEEEFFAAYNDQCDVVSLQQTELASIPALNRYYEELKSHEWRFGVGQSNSHFTHHLEERFDFGSWDIHLNCQDGTIQDVQIFSDVLYPDMVDELKKALSGAAYSVAGIHKAMKDVRVALEGKDGGAFVETLENWLVNAI